MTLDLLAAVASRCLALVPYLGLGFVLEELTNRRRALPTSARFNLAYGVLTLVIQFGLTVWWIRWVTATVSLLPGYGVLQFANPTTWGGIVLATAFCVLFRDGLYYGFHRLQHAWPWLWAQHELHHSDEHMNVTTGLRHHWLEVPFQMIVVVAPAEYLFAWPASVLIGLQVASDTLGYFIHADARISLGRFGRFIGTPMFHRIHHSRERQHWDKNFAAVCPLWDVLFGTYYAPAKDEYPETGVEGVEIRSLWQASSHPFRRWGQMLVGGSMKGWFARFVREETGQDLIEYALLAGFISLVAVAAITTVGAGVNGVYDNINAQVGSIPGGS